MHNDHLSEAGAKVELFMNANKKPALLELTKN